MNREFFVMLFGSKQFRSRLESLAVGTTMSSLNHSILKDLSVPVPPLAEQEKTVGEVKQMRSALAQLESRYRPKLSALEALKKALLHQAFTGQL